MSNVFAHTVCGLGGFFVFLLRITENVTNQCQIYKINRF
jgi:hypothetical protein